MKRQKRVAVINDVTWIWQMFCCCGTANHFRDEDTVLRDADSNPVCTHGISKLFFTGLYTIS